MAQVDPDVFSKCVALAEFVVVSESMALIGLDAIVSMSVVELIVVVVSIVHVGLDVVSMDLLELMLLMYLRLLRR